MYLDLYYIQWVSNVCVILTAVPRNYDPVLHPFEVPREYVRAMNATKLERLFAKPFLSSLDGHRDGVNCMAKHPKSLSTVLSGACDGEVSCSYRSPFFLLFSSCVWPFFNAPCLSLCVFVQLWHLLEGATYPFWSSVSQTAVSSFAVRIRVSKAAGFGCEQRVWYSIPQDGAVNVNIYSP